MVLVIEVILLAMVSLKTALAVTTARIQVGFDTSLVVHGVAAAPPSPASVFWPRERPSDPLLLDDAGHSGLGPRIADPAQASHGCQAHRALAV